MGAGSRESASEANARRKTLLALFALDRIVAFRGSSTPGATTSAGILSPIWISTRPRRVLKTERSDAVTAVNFPAIFSNVHFFERSSGEFSELFIELFLMFSFFERSS